MLSCTLSLKLKGWLTHVNVLSVKYYEDFLQLYYMFIDGKIEFFLQNHTSTNFFIYITQTERSKDKQENFLFLVIITRRT